MNPVVWSVFAVLSLIQFKLRWFVACCVALAMSFANIVGYYKCSKEQKAKVQNLVDQGAGLGIRAALNSGALRGD